jgi:endoribonuclease LACTB2
MLLHNHFQHDNVRAFRFGYHPLGKPTMFVHCFLVDGLLIDTGQSRARQAILEILGQQPVEQLFITHHHEDHTGNLPQLRAHFGCPTYSSARCAEMMQAPPRISLAQKLVWGERPADGDLTPIEGVLETNNHRFELIPIPGHAEDMVALYEPHRGWLFSADLYVHHRIKYFMASESMLGQIDSLKRVLALDFEVLFCAHNPQLTGGKEKVRQKLAFFEDFYGQVGLFAERHHNPGSIFKAMGLKEKTMTKYLSGGHLSAINMVRAALKDLNQPINNIHS